MMLLRDEDVRSVLDMSEVIARVEEAFAAHGRGETLTAGLTHTDAHGGEFHVKTGGLPDMFGAKVNGAFSPPDRATRPSIRGLILLFDARDGTPLAVMDSGAITAMRTGAATAVAAKYLARTESATVTIAGCGTQGRAQLEALTHVLPVRHVFAWSRSHERAEAFAVQAVEWFGIEVEPTTDLVASANASDVVVTCTPSTSPMLPADAVSPGSFVAAVGSDSPNKQELEPELLSQNRVVVDVLAQSASVGELHHAITSGLMQREDVYAELGAIVAGNVAGRTTPEQTFIFDSTGTALQDVAAGIVAWSRAQAVGVGTEFEFQQ